MSFATPRWFMEPEFEINEDGGYDYENFDDDEYEYENTYYSKYGESECIVCMGGSYIKKIFIGYESEGDYDEDYDF